ncbi:MAG: enoyl-CoA hydratase/isomerase family protein [Actinomycetes bacterium]
MSESHVSQGAEGALADGEAIDGVRVTHDGPITTVTLANPDNRNAQTPATWRALARVGSSLNPDVRAVILNAEGQSFSAGLDRRMFMAGIEGEASLADMAAFSDEQFDAKIGEYQQAFNWWRRSDAITVAAVSGHAVGAGFQLALAADLMVVADDVKFSMKETQLGLVPDLAGTHPLVMAVGYSRALEICASGRWVGADEAVALGIAVAVTTRENLDARVHELINSFLSAPAGAVTATKHLLSGATDRSHTEQQAAERAAQRRRILDIAAAMG